MTHKETILAHLATAPVKRALARVGHAVREPGKAKATKASVPSWILTLFETVFLPILPAILGILGARIMLKPKLVKYLEAAYVVLGGLLGKM